jgi:hypothetical protein
MSVFRKQDRQTDAEMERETVLSDMDAFLLENIPTCLFIQKMLVESSYMV